MTCRDFAAFARDCDRSTLPSEARAHLRTCAECAAEFRASGWSRRGFVQTAVAALAAAFTVGPRRLFGATRPAAITDPEAPIEYIVIGSGAGGGPLACNLARAGHKVVLFEAGGGTGANDYPFEANVPLFTGPTSEDKVIRWDYWVRHYADTTQQMRDTKYRPDEDPDGTGGIWYPRVGSLGGCTIHSFLFAIYPSESDWDHIAELTGDRSWAARNMRPYFERLERCHYVQPQPGNPSRHGFSGWQPTDIADPAQIYGGDPLVKRWVRAAMDEIYHGAGVVSQKVQQWLGKQLDPNDYRVRENRDGYYNVPAFMEHGVRKSPRDYILQTAAALPNNLVIQTNSLVTRILLDGDNRAYGVEYQEGARLYRADPNAAGGPGALKQLLLGTPHGEVILAAGAFNSPQILKLSGIGPAGELAAHGIPVRLNLPGVGQNLQDRYEVGIVTEMNEDFTYLSANGQACTFFSTYDSQGNPTDPCALQWFQGQGPYTTVGAYGAMLQTTPTAKALKQPDPDVFIIGAAARFRGYYLNLDNTTGYAETDINAHANQHTWLILKAHTLNRAGTVKLRSSDPRDTPVINFHYFDEGSDQKLNDLSALVDAIQLVRKMTARVADIQSANGELIPGPAVQTRQQIADFVKNECWGHHASCTNRMGGDRDEMAVVDSDFRVRGTRNLRIVDASVFPRIPGYFILTPIFMISEKATDAILAACAARRGVA